MRVLLVLITFLTVNQSIAQDKCYKTIPKAMKIGEYDKKKVVKNSHRVFYDKEAEQEFEKVLQKDEELRNLFLSEVMDEHSNISYIREREVYEYYPEIGIIIEGGGHGYISAFDIKNKREAYGNPCTYTYSPSRKFRFSGLNNDGMHYYLEEKIDGNYVLMGTVIFDGIVSGFYWIDDETICYLRERLKYDGSKYWIAYSSRFYPIVSK